ncbi:MAG: CbiX/SirB N-terminal domain-containing protein [Hyphomicrobium sp.]
MSGDAFRDVAVILAAHGDRAGATPNGRLLRLAATIRESGAFGLVTAGVLKGEPTIEQAVSDAIMTDDVIRERRTGRIVVYPLFMADGYFVRDVLPARIAAAGASDRYLMLPPLGLDARLPDLIHADALAATHRTGLAADATRLLIVGHGSELGPASANATRAAASAVAGIGGFAETATAFLEEPPFLDAVLADTRRSTVVSGFFSGDGLHAGEDVPEAIRKAGGAAIYAGSIAASAALPALILAAIRAAVAAP